MSRFEQTPSQEQPNIKVLESAQESYITELQRLKERLASARISENIFTALSTPGAIHMIAKFFGLEDIAGLEIPGNVDSLLILSWATFNLGVGTSWLVKKHFEDKIKLLKDKFGMLDQTQN